MRKKWIENCDLIAEHVKNVPGHLVGVAFDDDAKADAFLEYWNEHHPHVEMVDRQNLIGRYIFIRVRLKGALQ